MDIIKISLLGVCGVILGFLMKGTKPEYACFITVGIGLVIMGLAVGKIYYLFESLGKIQETLPVDTEYISTLVKMIGITYIGQFASGICKDAGYSTTAAQIELFCKLSVMVLSMPVLLALLALGFRNIRLGPTLPAFLSENVVKTLVDAYGLQPITAPQQDLDAILHRG
mgnify:CR=1 FL=1